jgi:hypothetical protein
VKRRERRIDEILRPQISHMSSAQVPLKPKGAGAWATASRLQSNGAGPRAPSSQIVGLAWARLSRLGLARLVALKPGRDITTHTPPTLGLEKKRSCGECVGCLQATTTVVMKCLHKVSVTPYNLLGNTAHRHFPCMSLSFLCYLRPC